jgi:hypothetical protein
VNVKNIFTSHIDKQICLTFLFLTTYLYTFSLYENPSFIIFSAETEYISTEMCCPKGKCGCQYFILLTLEEKKIMDTGVLDFF